MSHIILTQDIIDIPKVTADLRSDTDGGIVTFIGNVRNHTDSKKVIRLEFEAYEPMAIKELKKIQAYTVDTWPINRMTIIHRLGILYPSETAVFIGVSAPHRKAAFEACMYAIDTLKMTVPIWKKEIFEDGEVWVSAHP